MSLSDLPFTKQKLNSQTIIPGDSGYSEQQSKMKTQKEMRQAFWQWLKEINPKLYKDGRKSKRQNQQICDIRVAFCDWLSIQAITEKQKNNWSL